MAADLTSMRWHELALQQWCYSRFLVQDGYPIPVVFSSPMDAFSYFEQLWAMEGNPFAYLLDAKDANGTPLYLPHPAPLRYPLISIKRKGWSYRPEQNYSIHNNRRICWPTISNDVKRADLSMVRTARRPMAFNFKFQLDHFSMRPDGQAFFLQKLMDTFAPTSSGSLQTWMTVNYPDYYGAQNVRLVVDGGNIENMTPDEVPDNEVMIYRTGVQLVVEGYVPDLNFVDIPALWKVVFTNTIPATPQFLSDVFSTTLDLRSSTTNPTLLTRPNIPPTT